MSARDRFFVTGLRCFAGATYGECALNLMGFVVDPPRVPRGCWEDVPASLRQAKTTALWGGTDERGQGWILVSSSVVALRIFQTTMDTDAKTWRRNWWIDDELDSSDFYLLCKAEMFAEMQAASAR